MRDAGTEGPYELAHARVFLAPRDEVFAAWTDPRRLALWWGPAGFRTTIHAFDCTTGGRWLYTMHGPDGTDYENEMVFADIQAPERIVLEHKGAPPFRIFASFEDLGERTRLTFRQVFESEAALHAVHAYAKPANEQSLGRLGATLEGQAPA